MSATRVVLWRHGQTDLNVAGRIQGAQDFPLNDVGRGQAREAAKVLQAYAPAAIVASPLSRAYDTALALSEATGLAVERDERLRERSFGLWEGKSGDEINADYPEQYLAWRTGLDPEGVEVETRTDVGLRVAEAVAEWAEKVDGVLVVVAHGAAIKAGTTALLGMDASAWSGVKVLSNCHWTTLEYQRDYVPAWRISEHNVGAGTGEVATPH